MGIVRIKYYLCVHSIDIRVSCSVDYDEIDISAEEAVDAASEASVSAVVELLKAHVKNPFIQKRGSQALSAAIDADGWI